MLKLKYTPKLYSPLKNRVKLFIKKIKTKQDLHKEIKKEFLTIKKLPNKKNILPNMPNIILSDLLDPEIFFQDLNKIHLKKLEKKLGKKLNHNNIFLLEVKNILKFEKKISEFFLDFKNEELNLLIKKELSLLRKNLLLLIFYNPLNLNIKIKNRIFNLLSQLKTKSNEHTSYITWMYWLFSVRNTKYDIKDHVISLVNLNNKLLDFNNKITLLGKEIQIIDNKLLGKNNEINNKKYNLHFHINANVHIDIFNENNEIFSDMPIIETNSSNSQNNENDEWLKWLSYESNSYATSQNVIRELSYINSNEINLIDIELINFYKQSQSKFFLLQKSFNNLCLQNKLISYYKVFSLTNILKLTINQKAGFLFTKNSLTSITNYYFCGYTLIELSKLDSILFFDNKENSNLSNLNNWLNNTILESFSNKNNLTKTSYVSIYSLSNFKNNNLFKITNKNLSNKSYISKKTFLIKSLKWLSLIHLKNSKIQTFLVNIINDVSIKLSFEISIQQLQNSLVSNSLKNTFSSTKLITLDESIHKNKKSFKFDKFIPKYEKTLLESTHIIPIFSRSIDFYLKNITSQRYLASKKFDKHNTRIKTISNLLNSIFNFIKRYELQQKKTNLLYNFFFTHKFNNLKHKLNKILPNLFVLLNKSNKDNTKKQRKLETQRRQFWYTYINLIYLNKLRINSTPLINNYKTKSNLSNRLELNFLTKTFINLSAMYSKPLNKTSRYSKSIVSEKIKKLINPAILILNFKKSRFFPSLTNLKGRLFSTMSLGMFSKFFNKGKSFIKNKSVFLLVAGFLRKLILFSEIQGAMLLIKRVPLYFKEIISAIYDPVVSFYNSPFTGRVVNEALISNSFKFTSFMFFNNKPYGDVKNKQKGRLKRKITKRLISLNRMVD